MIVPSPKFSLCWIAAALLLCLAPVWAAQEPEPPKERPLAKGIRCVAFSPDGALLAAALGEPEERGWVALWDVASQKQIWTHAEDDGVPAVAFSPDGKTLAIGTYHHKAKLLEATTGRAVKDFDGHTRSVRAVAFSPDGKTLATGGWDHTVRLWGVATGKETMLLEWPAERVFGVSFSPGGQWLLAAGDMARVWDVATGMEKRSSSARSSDAAVFVDEACFLTGGYDGTLRLWNIAKGEQPPRLRSVGTSKIAYSPKNRLLAGTNGFGSGIDIFDFTLDEPSPKQKERIRQLLVLLDDDDYEVREKAGKDLLAVGFVAEPELRRVIKESDSAEVRIRGRRLHEALTSKTHATLLGHTDRVDGLAFTSDGLVLASGSKDGTVRLWNMAESKESARWVPKRP